MARNIHLLPFEGTDFIDPPVSDSGKEEIHASVDWETEFPVCLHADYDSKSPAGNVFCAVGRDVVGVSTPIFPPLVFCYSADFIPFFRFLPPFVFSLSFLFFPSPFSSPSFRFASFLRRQEKKRKKGRQARGCFLQLRRGGCQVDSSRGKLWLPFGRVMMKLYNSTECSRTICRLVTPLGQAYIYIVENVFILWKLK